MAPETPRIATDGVTSKWLKVEEMSRDARLVC
jgi:hypothetical protein